jgi:ATP-dependent Clp protease, protease subunit
MKTWYNIKAKAEGEAEITIYDEIGIWGVTAKAFINDLKKLGDVKNITLSVNSPGGSVFDGLAIYNALKNTRDGGATITAKVMGIAASAASFIVMAANTIEMPENSMMMVHYASGLAWGNADDMRETADILDKIDSSIVGIYTARTGKSEEDVRALLEAESWLTAAEAKEAGFADAVTENVKATAKFDMENLPENIRNLFKPESSGEPANAVANEIEDYAKAAGFEAHAAFFALNCATLDDAKVAIEQAREVKALCAVAKKDSMLAGFITNKTSLVDVRAQLQNAVAADAGREVDNHERTESTPSNEQPAAGLKTADVWAARQKQITNRKGA